MTNQGLCLLNVQMGGMLLGGILWGLGDKKGRLSVAFVRISAEEFGTTIPSTVATTAPNYARGALGLAVKSMKGTPLPGMVGAAAVIGTVLLLAFSSASILPRPTARTWII